MLLFRFNAPWFCAKVLFFFGNQLLVCLPNRILIIVLVHRFTFFNVKMRLDASCCHG